MNNQQIGILLMAAPILWLIYTVIKARQNGASHVSLNIFSLSLALTCWAAGRIIAGKGMIQMLLA